MSHDITECIAQCLAAGFTVSAPSSSRYRGRARKVFVVTGQFTTYGISNVEGVYSTVLLAQRAIAACKRGPGEISCPHKGHKILCFAVDA